MREAEIALLALVTVVAVAAGAEMIYFGLAGRLDIAAYSGVFFVLGLLAGRLLMP
jgi:hypothetical protein